ncbi:MAG TPA: hypothetical protein VHA15_05555 [Burkholderiales bacterium]|nr:hypothetical protein [Burkholderiales bacterium]
MKSRFPAALLSGLLFLPPALHASPVPAQFRGCDAAGWCKFWVDPRHTPDDPMHRVRPLGVPQMHGNDDVSIAVRDRLNALMADFIHQAKRIELHDLRRLDDGTYAARVTVTGIELASDPVLGDLGAKAAAARR